MNKLKYSILNPSLHPYIYVNLFLIREIYSSLEKDMNLKEYKSQKVNAKCLALEI